MTQRQSKTTTVQVTNSGRTAQQILELAISKAIDGGWKNEDMLSADSHIDGWLFDPGIGEYGGHKEPHSLIFNHDFAKALWGEEPSNHYFGVDGIPEWQHHLQQMVIADDPIKYLGENI